MTSSSTAAVTLMFHQQTDLLQHCTSGSLPPTFANEMSPASSNWVTKTASIFSAVHPQRIWPNDDRSTAINRHRMARLHADADAHTKERSFGHVPKGAGFDPMKKNP